MVFESLVCSVEAGQWLVKWGSKKELNPINILTSTFGRACLLIGGAFPFCLSFYVKFTQLMLYGLGGSIRGVE